LNCALVVPEPLSAATACTRRACATDAAEAAFGFQHVDDLLRALAEEDGPASSRIANAVALDHAMKCRV
jgi:hypothetical protein